MPDSPTTSVRRAVLVGINAYAERPLDGCVNDAEMMAGLLRERFSFDPANITLLLDEAASRDAVLAALDAMVAATERDDMAFFFYAGHGSLAPTDDRTEASGFDSTLNVCEAPREDIYDHQIRFRLEDLAAKTQNTVFVIDACHSGTISRDASLLPGRKVRSTPPAPRGTRPSEPKRARTESAALDSSYVLIAACRDDEEGKENTRLTYDEPAHGLLSLGVAQALRTATTGTTWRQVFDRASAWVTGQNPEQHPQIEGRADRVLFGLTELPPISPFVIRERTESTVLLGAGSLHGVAQGMLCTVFAPDTQAGSTDTPLGTVEVTLVKGTSAHARIVSEAKPESIAAGARAVPAYRETIEHVLALQNDAADSALRGTVTLEILRRDDEGAFSLAVTEDGMTMPALTTGEVFAVRVTNNSPTPVWANLFYINPVGEIDAVTTGSANQIAVNSPWEIGTEPKRGLKLQWDDDNTVWSFKLFASVQPVDLSYLTRLGEASRSTEGTVGAISSDDWTAVTTQITLLRSTELDTSRSVAVAGASVSALGMAGTIRGAGSSGAAALMPPDALTQALAAEGMVTQQSFVLTDARAVNDGTRSADGPPVLNVQVPDAGEGYAQVAMTTDADGVVHWHFAQELDPAPATRDGTVPTLRTRTFAIPGHTTTVAADGERGMLSELATKLINVYCFPVGKALIGMAADSVGERLDLWRTPYGIRTFLPDSYATKDAPAVDAAMWETLGTGRALLMIHGTNSQTHTAFGDLPKAFVEEMHARYEGRVFAFDHPSLTHSPRKNVETFLSMMPAGITLDVDIICHSRGGLVSRVFSEKLSELAPGAPAVSVNRVVFVGAPNSGTPMADEKTIGDMFDTLTNLLNVIPTNGVTDAMSLVLTGVKLLATGLWSSLDGLRSMQPEGEFGAWLNVGERSDRTHYFALTSNYTPTHKTLMRLATDRLADRIFKGTANDMVVPTDGVFAANGSGYFPIAEQVVFGASDGVAHTSFFQYPKTTAQLSSWLAR